MAVEAHHHVDVHQRTLEQGVVELIAHCGLQHHYSTCQQWTPSMHGAALQLMGNQASQVQKLPTSYQDGTLWIDNGRHRATDA